ncbi:hypothetical protein [Micromonospora endolithica]|uniref:Uncharacterized protein n=1 Tax=Micromonospora endolithica TaxID=230091 RepID=A0A3A9YXD8_9ACTN|nr:hypothetical protein [Micromonospora endolithica]RKN39917.1 hypothetical protein D7223_27615 [Micromonospora endolithica]TWJ26071.1 hypothetical protein JD76_06249 [Micromonospora endolithica]
MSRDLPDLYRSLAADADEGGLAVPETIRRYADRRARVRAAGGALVVALLVGGVAAGIQLGLPGGRTSTLPATTPTPAVTPTPSTPPPPTATPTPSRSVPSGTPSAPATTASTRPPRTPTSIPDRAFFVPPAAYLKGEPTFTDGEHLPDPCGEQPDDQIVQRRSRVIMYHLKPNQPDEYVPDGSYTHSVTIHRPGTADDWMDDLRQLVRDCPRQDMGQGVVSRQRLLDGGAYGEETVLFEMRTPARTDSGEPAAGETVRLVRAVRVGDVVTVLWERGWESTSTVRSQFDDYSRRAERAVEAWLD